MEYRRKLWSKLKIILWPNKYFKRYQFADLIFDKQNIHETSIFMPMTIKYVVTTIKLGM